MRRRCVFLLLQRIIFGVILCLSIDGHAAASDYKDTPIILHAKDVLPKKWQQGENYQVDDIVKNDGLINTYQLKTDSGQYTIESTAALMMRINELNAITVMNKMDRSEVLGDAVLEGAKAPVKGAAALVTSPVETSKDIAKGTGRFFSNLGRAIFSDDPDQDNALKVALGYDTAKRQFAYELGIDPYSAYEPVVNRLGEIARAAVAGGLAPRAVMVGIDHDLARAMAVSATAKGMRKLVRDNPPGELKKINRKKLAAMGGDSSLIEAFLDNYRYNPQEETLLVGALASMKRVKGRPIFIGKASRARDKAMARFNRLMTEMMAGYYTDVSSDIEIIDVGGPIGLRRKDGVMVFLAPIDHIFWTPAVEGKLVKLDTGIQKLGRVSGKELWITGNIGAIALKHMEARGWKVRDHVQDALVE